MRKHFADRICVAGLERHQRGVDDALVFTGEFLRDQFFQFVGVEIENFRDQSEHENVFALVLRGAAERFDRKASNGDADVDETFVVEVRLDVVGIVKKDPAFAQKMEVILIAVLIKCDQKIGLVACGQHFARTDAYLEN